jgi:RecB family endonuclease NucS
VEEIEDAANLKFGLEGDMQDALRRNIGQLDPTLRIVDDGKERRVEAGLIDILAEDQEGARVVVELKSGEAPESAITHCSRTSAPYKTKMLLARCAAC